MVLLDRLEEPAPPLPLAARLDALRRAISEEHGLALRAAVNVLHTAPRNSSLSPQQQRALLPPPSLAAGVLSEWQETSLGAGGVGSLGLLD